MTALLIVFLLIHRFGYPWWCNLIALGIFRLDLWILERLIGRRQCCCAASSAQTAGSSESERPDSQA
jgi:hypothetical protein